MLLMYKQLTKQILKNKLFIILLFLLTILTSLSFFFVKFSVDGNLANLHILTQLTEGQLRYQNALESNTTLAYSFLASLTGLTSFVFAMFFYRFFRQNQKQIACLRSLGFRHRQLCTFFIVFTAVLSAAGALAGMAGGYVLSDVLINANMQTYGVQALVKAASPFSVLLGLIAASTVFCLTVFVCCSFMNSAEPGIQLAGTQHKQRYNAALRAANAMSRAFPIRNQFPLRIALRKPIAVLLIFLSVMAFSVCMILGRSLNISSQTVMHTQTAGHNYTFDITYDSMQHLPATASGSIPYLVFSGYVSFGKTDLDQTILALYYEDAVFTLLSSSGQPIALPASGGIIIGPGLADTYGLRVGDAVCVSAAQAALELQVLAVAENAKSASVYLNPYDAAALYGISDGMFNGELLRAAPHTALPAGAQMITQEERLEALTRDAVSNNVSAVINQLTGILVGCILIFLALYINFQDNTRDMLILHLLGYQNNEIRKMLVDVYRPILWIAFFITLAPSILLAKSIQRSLSISTNDYMPFGTSAWVLVTAFAVLNMIYMLVQFVFRFGIKRITKKEQIAAYTNE